MRFMGWDDFKLITKLDAINDLEVLFNSTNSMCKQQYEALEKQAEGIDDEEVKQEFYEFHQEHFLLYEETLPRINNYSILTNIWTHLEFNIYQLANEAIKKFGLTVSVTGNKLDDYLRFCRVNIEGEFVDSEKEEKKEILRIIRNRIIHDNGYVKRESTNIQHVKAIEYVESHEGLSFTEDDRIIVVNSYVEECLSVAREILVEIHSAIYK
ncbi:MAG: hypothetical protein ABS942_16215 [Solibacillus sp.]|uniref:hypothetical protein n=1 Tax=Solibacillus sp. TaxID=1909654 RepID=UPI003315932D